jgi:hypothetical protein
MALEALCEAFVGRFAQPSELQSRSWPILQQDFPLASANHRSSSMRRSFSSSSGFALVIAVLGSLFQPLAAAMAAEVSWTFAGAAPNPRNDLDECSGSISGDHPRVCRWNFETKRPTPFGYSLHVTYGPKIGQSRQPIALLSPDLAYLAIGSDSYGVEIVDRLKKNNVAGQFIPIRQIMKGRADSSRGVQDLAFYRFGDKLTLIVADGSNELTLWDPSSGNRLAAIAHDRAGDPIAFAPGPRDSLLVAIGAQLRKCDFALKKWDTQQQKFPAPVVAIAASEYRRVVAVATADGLINPF